MSEIIKVGLEMAKNDLGRAFLQNSCCERFTAKIRIVSRSG